MAFETGTASSLANLQSKIETFLTVTAGYTLTSGILTKTGTDIHVKFDNTENTAWLTLEMGKDSSAGTLLHKHPLWSESVPQKVGIAEQIFSSGQSMVFPINYDFQHLTTNGEMFRCVVEFNNGYTQNIGFGEVVKAVNFQGGVYVDASSTYRILNGIRSMDGWTLSSTSISWLGTAPVQNISNSGAIGLAPFFNRSNINLLDRAAATQVWAEVSGYDWYTNSEINSANAIWAGTKYANGTGTHRSLVTNRFSDLEAGASLQVNNGNNTLVPIRLFGVASDGNYQRLGDVPDIRWTNIKNLNFGQVLDDGTDKWKCYPAYFKNAASLNGDADDSGQIGFAVRYDGP